MGWEMTGRTIFTLLVSMKVMLRKVYALSRRLKGDLNAQRLVKEDECLRQSEWCAMCYAAPPLTRVTVSSSRNAKNNRGEERPSLCLFLFLPAPSYWFLITAMKLRRRFRCSPIDPSMEWSKKTDWHADRRVVGVFIVFLSKKATLPHTIGWADRVPTQAGS